MGLDMVSEVHLNFCLIWAQSFSVEMTIGLVQ